jgi:hypothetical protein
MASTFTIPLTTLPVGQRDLGPANVPDADTFARITIDRTVTGGLNSLTTATTIDITIWQSDDGGTTWFGGGGTTCIGGVKNGRFANADNVNVSFEPGTSRKVKATVVVAGSSVAVQGTLTTT